MTPEATETVHVEFTVSWEYTPECWLESIIKADGTILTFEYDKTGSLLSQNVGEGQSISSECNEIGKVAKVSSPEGTICYQNDERRYLRAKAFTF